MKKQFLVLGSSLLVVVFSASAALATNYVLGYSSVDAGEIRWGGSTTYSTQWNGAIGTWNALSNGVNIAPDTAWTYEDLRVSDVNRSYVTWTGQYTRSAGTDNLRLNRYYLNNNTNAQRQNTATHELGHALGLAHSISGNVMYYAQTSQTSLGTQDVTDYTFLWGN